jgi:hypothetical protein
MPSRERNASNMKVDPDGKALERSSLTAMRSSWLVS